MLQYLEFEFIQFALIAGTITGIVCSYLGNFLVGQRQSLVPDMLSHTAIMGVALGLCLQVSPLWTAVIVCVLASVSLWFLSRGDRRPTEAISVLILTGSLALAFLLAHISVGQSINFESLLFGSILTITSSELLSLIAVQALVFLVLCKYYRVFQGIIFDLEYSKSQNRHTERFAFLFSIISALTIAVSIKVIGGLLITALLIIPVLAASNVSKSFFQNVIISGVFNVLAVWIGISSSYIFDIPSSSAIVLTLIMIFAISALFRRR